MVVVNIFVEEEVVEEGVLHVEKGRRSSLLRTLQGYNTSYILSVILVV